VPDMRFTLAFALAAFVLVGGAQAQPSAQRDTIVVHLSATGLAPFDGGICH
jgi:hypothetical protein